MKINLDQVFVSLGGDRPILLDGEPMTLKDAASGALASSTGGTPEKSLQRLKLARRISASNKGEVFELTTEEAVEIKLLTSQTFNSLIAGQVVEMIEDITETNRLKAV